MHSTAGTVVMVVAGISVTAAILLLLGIVIDAVGWWLFVAVGVALLLGYRKGGGTV